MDLIDLKLLQLLWQDPRRSYRDIADALNLSTPAVHRRIQSAKESGILVGPFANISPSFVGAVSVVIIGRSRAASLGEVQKEFARNESTYIVHMLTGMTLMVRGILRNIGELDRYVKFVREAARMPDPVIGIGTSDECEGEPCEEGAGRVSKLDLRIIRSLREDGRKGVNDIASEIHVSPKTVRRHLERLQRDHIIDLNLIADQSRTGNMVPMLQIYLSEECDKKKVRDNILQKYPSVMISIESFSNMPHMLLGAAWLQNMGQLKELLSNLSAEDGVASVVPNILVTSFLQDTWMDSLLDDPDKALDFFRRKNMV